MKHPKRCVWASEQPGSDSATSASIKLASLKRQPCPETEQFSCLLGDNPPSWEIRRPCAGLSETWPALASSALKLCHLPPGDCLPGSWGPGDSLCHHSLFLSSEGPSGCSHEWSPQEQKKYHCPLCEQDGTAVSPLVTSAKGTQAPCRPCSPSPHPDYRTPGQVPCPHTCGTNHPRSPVVFVLHRSLAWRGFPHPALTFLSLRLHLQHGDPCCLSSGSRSFLQQPGGSHVTFHSACQHVSLGSC